MSNPKFPAKILVVDDDEVTRNLIKEVLDRSFQTVVLASSGEEAIQWIKKAPFAVILSDIRMIELDGMAVLKAAKKADPMTAVILMTGFGSMEGAVEAIQEGAFDYISKPFQLDELKAILSRALKHWESLRETALTSKDDKKKQSHQTMNVTPQGIIGKSPKIVEVYKIIARAALSSSTTLIQGESGTGKERVARAIHDHSPRKKEHFVAINCGALSESLLESELFGHLRGSFTGAVVDKKGLFESAHRGTLFLDEIGDIPLSLQVKLLRVIQEGEIRPVGSNESKQVDVRLIAATHRDLEVMVRQGKFREDLYYRLKVISIDLPPLRDRLEDLPDLMEYFLIRFSQKNQKAVSHISEEARKLLFAYPWPGNVRELEHAVERAVAMTKTSILYPEDFPPEVMKGAPSPSSSVSTGHEEAHSLDDMERTHIMRVLQETGYNKSRASEILGIDRATLYRKAQRYDIDLRGK